MTFVEKSKAWELSMHHDHFSWKDLSMEEIEMRATFFTFLAALLIAAMPLPAQSKAAPVKGTVQGTATVGKGIVRGAGQAGLGVARGTVTVARSTGSGLRCIATLGNRC
jgi:hypothetical protein